MIPQRFALVFVGMDALATTIAANPPAYRQYYLQRPLWRAALWGVLGFGAIICEIWALDAAGLSRPNTPTFTVTLFYSLFALFIAQYLLTRVRVDENGIHRRILWWWDAWTWESFTEGRVSHGTYIHGYQNTDKPFWAQRLELSALEPEAAKEIDGLIKRIWTQPSLPECPETIVLTLKEIGRPSLTLTADGIEFTRRQQTVSCRWADVPMVRFWRLESDRADFRRLIFQLPNREIRLGRPPHNGRQLQTWTGPTPEIVSRFVLTYGRHVEDYAISGDARTLHELEAKSDLQLGDLQQRTTILKRLCWVTAALCLACPLVCPWPKAALTSLYLFAVVGLYREAAQKLATTRTDFDRQRELLEPER